MVAAMHYEIGDDVRYVQGLQGVLSGRGCWI